VSPVSRQDSEVQSYWGIQTVASFAELLIDCEEDWIRAVLVGMLREGDRK